MRGALAAAWLAVLAFSLTLPGGAVHRASAQTAPTVASIAVDAPIDGETFERSEQISVRVRFSAGVRATYPNNNSRPRIALDIGGTTRYAVYRSAPGTDELLFQYWVQQADSDTNGLVIAANAIGLNGGAIQSSASMPVNADITHAVTVAADTNRKVDGSRVSAPKITGFTWGTLAETVLRGETLEIRVRFDRLMQVTGTPRVALDIGGTTRYASLYSPVPGITGYDARFRYTVASSDSDTDGVTVDANALELNGGTIVSFADSTVNANLAHDALAPGALRRVDGSSVPVPTVTGLGANRGTFWRGETMSVSIAFSSRVNVTGTPRLALIVGTVTRYAEYVSGSGTKTLRFHYTVQQADSDTDGVEVNANALELNGGTIVSSASSATNANLAHRSLRTPANADGSRVRSPTLTGISTGTPGTRAGEAVARGFRIRISVGFNRAVRIVGEPRLQLTIGTQTRYTSLLYHPAGSESVLFVYTVQAGDSDADGITIPANPIDLNGGTITSVVDGATAATLTHAEVSTTVNVDGSIQRAPRVEGIWLMDQRERHEVFGSGPAQGNTYGRGERIVARVQFYPPVAVTGTPRLALTIGTETRYAELYYVARLNPYGNQFLFFNYVVRGSSSSLNEDEDSDTDGIGIPANALELNGGTIRLQGTTTDADLASNAVPGTEHPYGVDGDQVAAPAVRGVDLHSAPPSDGVYRLGDTIVARAWFRSAVEVTGTPQLALTVGGATRQASFTTLHTVTLDGRRVTQSLPDTLGWMLFAYTVQAGDLDLDGVAIAANALSLNGGTIRLKGSARSADATNATRTHDAAAADPWHLADGLTRIRADDEGPPVVGEPLVAGASHQSRRAEPSPPATSVACDAVSASASHEPWVWQRSDDGETGWTDVSASRGSDCTYVYVPSAGDAGKRFRARIPLTATAATAAGAPAGDRYATTEVTAAAVASSAAVGGTGLFLSGHQTPRVGQAIETMKPFVAGGGGLHRPNGGWRWRVCDDAAMTSNCALLQDADGISYRYTPATADQGKYLEAWLYVSFDSGASWRRWETAAIGPVQAAAAP